MYADLILAAFPADDNLGMYRYPNLPATKLGKVLAGATRIKTPGEVIAFLYEGGLFSSNYVIFSMDYVFYPNGSFPLRELRGVSVDGKKIACTVNQAGATVEHILKTGNETVANAIGGVLRQILDALDTVETADISSMNSMDFAMIDWKRLRPELEATIAKLEEMYEQGMLTSNQIDDVRITLLSRGS